MPFDDLQSKLVPLSPNWRESYYVRYEFKTDIFTSRSGKEQRRAQRPNPRRQLRYTVTAAGDRMRSVTRLIERYQGQSYTLPDWSRHARAATSLAIGGSSFELTADAPFWIAPTRGIILVDEATGRQALRTVQSVVGLVVTTEQVSSDAWPAGTMILPAETGRLDTSIDARNHTDQVLEADVTFNCEPGYGPVFAYDPPLVEDFGGREVFPFAPNRATAISGSFEHNLDQVDFGRGRITTYMPIAFGRRIRRLQLNLMDLTERLELVAFFHRMRGQQGEFYIPTFDSDLPLAAPAAAGGTTLRVTGTEVADLMADSTTHRVIRLQWTGGYTFYRRIISVAVSGSDTLLTTDPDTPWPIDISVDTLAAPLCWMVPARFATDTLEVECLTTTAGRAQLSIVTLEDLAVSQTDNAWGLTDDQQALTDIFGYLFTSPEIADPLDEWVNVRYPDATAGL